MFAGDARGYRWWAKLVGAFGDVCGDILDFACPSSLAGYARGRGKLELEWVQR
jgi:hypothetical protein